MHGRLAKTLAALAVTFASAAGTAHAAVTTNDPTSAGGRTFATTDGGWTHSTVVSGICLVVCSNGAGTFQATGGAGTAPDGYLRANFDTGVGVLSDTATTWTSPSFMASGDIDQAMLNAKVRTQLGSLLTLLGGTGTITAKLRDTGTWTTTTLPTISLANGTSFVPVRSAVPGGALVAGHTYTLAITVRATTGAVAAVLASGTVDLDDLSLDVTDPLPPTNLSATVNATSGVQICGDVDPTTSRPRSSSTAATAPPTAPRRPRSSSTAPGSSPAASH